MSVFPSGHLRAIGRFFCCINGSVEDIIDFFTPGVHQIEGVQAAIQTTNIAFTITSIFTATSVSIHNLGTYYVRATIAGPAGGNLAVLIPPGVAKDITFDVPVVTQVVLQAVDLIGAGGGVDTMTPTVGPLAAIQNLTVEFLEG